jgi:hypothetical protein
MGRKKGRQDGKAGRRNPLLGAAVVRVVLQKQGGEGATSVLYEGLLRDLGLTDDEVRTFLDEHAGEVAAALQGQGRRG